MKPYIAYASGLLAIYSGGYATASPGLDWLLDGITVALWAIFIVSVRRQCHAGMVVMVGPSGGGGGPGTNSPINRIRRFRRRLYEKWEMS